MNWKKFTTTLVAATTAIGLIAPVQAQQPLQKVKIRMDWVPSGIYGGFYHAQQNGFYAREGLDVEILAGNGSNATMDGMLRGDTEFGFVTCWAAAIGIGKGRSVVSVSTYTGENGYSFFTAKSANVQSLKDLAGKTIVVTPSGFDTQLFPAVFVSNGLPASSLRSINVDPTQKIPTYARGQADVVVSNLAYADPLIQEQRPSNYIQWSKVGFVLPDYCVATTRERAEKDPQLVERFLRATYAGTAEAARRPQAAADAALKSNPLLKRDVTLRQWELMSTLFYTEDTKSCPHGWHSPKDWTQALNTLQKFGGLEGPIDDHGKFYTNRFFRCDKG